MTIPVMPVISVAYNLPLRLLLYKGNYEYTFYCRNEVQSLNLRVTEEFKKVLEKFICAS